jgi:anti-sigma regulatory factor (Ser/Thr protein kinase)
MPSAPTHAFPAHFSNDDAHHLARGTWSPRSVRSARVGLEGSSGAPGMAREAVGLHLTRLTGVQRDDVRLLVTELVTNAIRHGEGASGVVMYLAESVGRVRIEVCDGGEGFGFSRAARPDGAVGGLGLRLLDLTADRWGIAGDDGTCVWFELDLVQSPRVDPATGR